MIKQINIRESYKLYKIRANNYGFERIATKEYLYIINGFIKFLMRRVFAGSDVKLPADMGTLGIRCTKVKPRIGDDGRIKGLAPNWPKTLELWNNNAEAKAEKRIVYCFNEHSNGMRYRFVWSRLNSIFTNKTVYSLQMSRPNKRVVNKMAHNGTAEFLETKPKYNGRRTSVN